MGGRFNNTESELVYLRAELLKYAKDCRAIQVITDQQANDEGLWFDAQTAPEAYLQIELRRLHAEIEGRLRRLKGD